MAIFTNMLRLLLGEFFSISFLCFKNSSETKQRRVERSERAVKQRELGGTWRAKHWSMTQLLEQAYWFFIRPLTSQTQKQEDAWVTDIFTFTTYQPTNQPSDQVTKRTAAHGHVWLTCLFTGLKSNAPRRLKVTAAITRDARALPCLSVPSQRSMLSVSQHPSTFSVVVVITVIGHVAVDEALNYYYYYYYYLV
jgi:hypothetical protein